MGIISLKDWKTASQARLFWEVASGQNEGWIRSKYLKKDSVWDVRISANASWAWRHILKESPTCSCFASYLRWAGNKWSDPWLKQGRICDLVGEIEDGTTWVSGY